jgi:hypothetical protein
MTQEDLMEFIRARCESQDGFTAGQVAERLGTNVKAVRAILTPMLKRGQLDPVMVLIVDPWGRRFKVPGYRMKA